MKTLTLVLAMILLTACGSSKQTANEKSQELIICEKITQEQDTHIQELYHIIDTYETKLNELSKRKN
tara:strand:+ start:225042 stop:225242 length:201 start_codon:yes stop_codon:yes gene_type:complete